MKLHKALAVPLLLSVPVVAWAADAAHPDVIAISAVQGSGLQSPMVGQRVTVEGIAVYAGNPQATPVGLYLQSTKPDVAGKASNAIYVVLPPAMMAPARSSLLRVTGTVAELGKGKDTMTSLVDVQVETHGVGKVSWPSFNPARLDELGLERHEGEALTWQVVVADTGHYDDRGEIEASLGQRLFTPTEVAAPCVAAPDSAKTHSAPPPVLDAFAGRPAGGAALGLPEIDDLGACTRSRRHRPRRFRRGRPTQRDVSPHSRRRRRHLETRPRQPAPVRARRQGQRPHREPPRA